MEQVPGQIRAINFELDLHQTKVEHLIKFVDSMTDETFEYEGAIVASNGKGSGVGPVTRQVISMEIG